MIRALYAAVSGLNNHQLKLDVIGNNIANINTYGFKGSRITFAETLAQQEGAPYAPHDRFGGVNPMEVGLGIKTSSIDNNFTQGNLLSTGITTDLAVQGDGFFVISDGLKNYYTRAGAFQIDAQGQLVAQGGRYFVQGRLADASGNIASGTNVQNITLPFGEKEPAKATSSIDYFCNLNADSDALQKINTASDAYVTFASVNATQDPTTGYPYDVVTGTNDELEIALGSGSSVTIAVAEGTYADSAALGDAINDAIGDSSLGGGVSAFVDSETGFIRFRTVDLGSDTSLTITGGIAGTLSGDLGITANTTGTGAVTTSTLLNDLFYPISEGYNDNELSALDTIDITGSESDGTSVSAIYTYTEGDTVAELIAAIDSAFAGSEATLDSEGKIVVTDNYAGSSSSVVSLNAGSGVNFLTPSFDVTQDGRDAGTHSTSINVYDSLGNAHLVEMIFTKAPDTNSWTWEAKVDNGLITPTAGSSGTLTFNNDGSLATFNYDDDDSALIFTPSGADAVSINMNPGTPGNFDGITQFDSPSTTIAISQDGYTMGDLEDISIGVDGTIAGAFSNGVVRTLGQIVLADFTNTGGLSKAGNNMYVESPNSGQAVIGAAQTNFSASINSGYVEMSNVDLTREFTELIVAQRGFQANARVIQTSDMVLAEINGLKR
ncbi:MAG: flagellar hook-basal body complex protein [candidate division Zixibacteria bacterium]|nr:flagellar hook-basal body complex protein [Candidatus Tariuqbacter arcticus]